MANETEPIFLHEYFYTYIQGYPQFDFRVNCTKIKLSLFHDFMQKFLKQRLY